MKFLKNKKIFKNQDFFILLPNLLDIVECKPNLNVCLDDILFVEDQKKLILDNTTRFSKNLESSNCFLWGARGMGKSSLIKCAIQRVNEINKNKLKLIEILNHNFIYLPELMYFLRKLNHNFVIFIDDITFEEKSSDFKLFKSILEGSLLSDSPNVKFYVSSNLRHLSLEKNMNSETDEIIKKEVLTNLVSLSDRFGCKIGFFENNQENYLKIVKYYAKKKKINLSELNIKESVQWSLQKGNFSGRSACQFIDNLKT